MLPSRANAIRVLSGDQHGASPLRIISLSSAPWPSAVQTFPSRTKANRQVRPSGRLLRPVGNSAALAVDWLLGRYAGQIRTPPGEPPAIPLPLGEKAADQRSMSHSRLLRQAEASHSFTPSSPAVITVWLSSENLTQRTGRR